METIVNKAAARPGSGNPASGAGPGAGEWLSGIKRHGDGAVDGNRPAGYRRD
ncbi:hypothetical protein [Hydrogenispora ethanolica]|uniref:hypothetical protein n=1 Tax=Hydrogenispora ethanolica TaxID=1082276 RepID=UPI001404BBDC|nr:hypothetical protein [Hydrogenispora ethanolica]